MYIDILLKSPKNNRYIQRYIKFIDYCLKINHNKNFEGENHHILPKSIFPEYSDFRKNKWNKIKLTYKQHFISHWMLAKIFGASQWFSFNQMRRIGKNSILYSYCKEDIRKNLSTINLGRKHSDKTKLGCSIRTKSKVVVRDKQGNVFQTSIYDPEYLSGEFVFYRTGSKHKKSTKDKMSKNNGRKNKVPFIDNNDHMSYHELSVGLSLGLTPGSSKEYKENMSKTLKELIWVTIIETNKITKIKKDLFDDSIYIRGRKGFKGFAKINERKQSI